MRSTWASTRNRWSSIMPNSCRARPLAPKAVIPPTRRRCRAPRSWRSGRLPQMPKFAFKLNGMPGGAGGLVASLAGAVMLFAGVSYMLMPGRRADPSASRSRWPRRANLPQIDADRLDRPGETAEIKVGDEPMTDDERVAAAAECRRDDLAGTGLDGIDDSDRANRAGRPRNQTTLEGMASADDVAMTGEGPRIRHRERGQPTDAEGQGARLGPDRGRPGQCGDDPDADEGRHLQRAEPRGPGGHRA